MGIYVDSLGHPFQYLCLCNILMIHVMEIEITAAMFTPHESSFDEQTYECFSSGMGNG